MRARKGIIVAATVTALWSLALPAHAGADGFDGAKGGNGAGDLAVTAADCTSVGGTVVNGVCQGGTADGASVSG